MQTLLAALGNPGKRYALTRHNAGWLFADAVLNELNCRCSEKFKGIFCNCGDFFILKPLTFMNESGKSVCSALNNLQLPPKALLLVHDELDLPLGKARLRFGGSSAGHRGVESVIRELGTKEFWRLKIGIGRPESKEEVVNYVLSPFEKSELEILQKVIEESKKVLFSQRQLKPITISVGG